MGKKASLPTHEWLAVTVLIVIITFYISIIALDHKSPRKVSEAPHHVNSSCIEVSVSGCVENPGTYVLPKGATINKIYELVKPSTQADLKLISEKTPLKNGQKIVFQEINYINITLKGAVIAPGPLKVPKGTKRMDLISSIQFTEDADYTILNKKRKLKDGEVITIPRVAK